MTIGGLSPIDFGKRLFHEFTTDDIGGLAAELSYRYFLAIFPFFIFLAALGGFVASATSVDDPTADIMDLLGDNLPEDARSLLRGQLDDVLESQSVGLLSVGIVGALWAASGAMKSLMKALNRAYDVPETRPFWKSTGLAILMTLTVTIGIVGSILLLGATQAFGADLADRVGAGDAFELLVTVVRWPAVVLLLLLAVAVLYWVAPNIDIPFKWITPGSVLFVVVWLAATVAFGLYVSNFGSYNKTYGALGGVVILLTWLYLTNAVLLLGAEINALTAELKEPQLQQERRERVSREATFAQQKQAMEPPAEPPRDAAPRRPST